MKQFKDFGITTPPAVLQGKKIPIEEVLNLEIVVYSFDIQPSKWGGKCLYLQISLEGVKRVVFTTGKALIGDIQKVPTDGFPFQTTVIKDDKRYLFK